MCDKHVKKPNLRQYFACLQITRNAIPKTTPKYRMNEIFFSFNENCARDTKTEWSINLRPILYETRTKLQTLRKVELIKTVGFFKTVKFSAWPSVNLNNDIEILIYVAKVPPVS